MLLQTNNISPFLLEFVNPHSSMRWKKTLPLSLAVKGSTLIIKKTQKPPHFFHQQIQFFLKWCSIKYQLRKTGIRAPTKVLWRKLDTGWGWRELWRLFSSSSCSKLGQLQEGCLSSHVLCISNLVQCWTTLQYFIIMFKLNCLCLSLCSLPLVLSPGIRKDYAIIIHHLWADVTFPWSETG